MDILRWSLACDNNNNIFVFTTKSKQITKGNMIHISFLLASTMNVFFILLYESKTYIVSYQL